LVPYKQWFKVNGKARATFIANLRIPTYKKFQHYNFYDVVLELCKNICSIKFLFGKISEQRKYYKERKEKRELKLTGLRKNKTDTPSLPPIIPSQESEELA